MARGGYAMSRERITRQQMPREDNGRSFNLPAPIGGWNARGNLSTMGPLDAITLDNLFPGVQNVVLRKGVAAHATGLPANVLSLFAYNSAGTGKLFASTGAAIYDVSVAGAVGASVATCTNGFWIDTVFSAGGADYLVLANGVDSMKIYSTAGGWVTVTGVSTPAITGITTSTVTYVSSHKGRLWLTSANSLNLYYLPVASVGGAATLFPVGQFFTQGGYIVATASWTIDGGAGVDDLFVILTSEGEIAVYQGTDPSSADTWALIGVYNIGKPMGQKPLMKFGGDLIVLCRNGLFPMSKLLQSTAVDNTSAVSYKIEQALLDAASEFGLNTGWQMILHKTENMLLVNVPVSSQGTSYQYVMNTVTKAWCRFTNWNAFCWADLDGDLYFGGANIVDKAWSGNNDKGTAITASLAQAYQPLGFRGQKAVSLIRPALECDDNVAITYSVDTDFKQFDSSTVIQYSFANTGSEWDSAIWDTSTWGSDEGVIEPKWMTVPANIGYLHSFRLQLTTSTANIGLTSTDFLIRPAGIL